MSTPEILPPSAPSSGFRLVATLGLIALFSGLLVVTAVEVTRERIQENQLRALEAAVLRIIPGAVERREFVLDAQGVWPRAEAPGAGQIIHAGYDAQGQLRGLALQAAGRGYADVIRVLYGYDPACACIVGLMVLETRETPGLGDKIETDPVFVANFDRLPLGLDATGQDLAHEIVTVRRGTASQPGEIDGITGATISARAIGDMLTQSARSLLPLLAPHWSVFQGDTVVDAVPEEGGDMSGSGNDDTGRDAQSVHSSGDITRDMGD